MAVIEAPPLDRAIGEFLAFLRVERGRDDWEQWDENVGTIVDVIDDERWQAVEPGPFGCRHSGQHHGLGDNVDQRLARQAVQFVGVESLDGGAATLRSSRKRASRSLPIP